jgi:hypothetical protein
MAAIDEDDKLSQILEHIKKLDWKVVQLKDDSAAFKANNTALKV